MYSPVSRWRSRYGRRVKTSTWRICRSADYTAWTSTSGWRRTWPRSARTPSAATGISPNARSPAASKAHGLPLHRLRPSQGRSGPVTRRLPGIGRPRSTSTPSSWSTAGPTSCCAATKRASGRRRRTWPAWPPSTVSTWRRSSSSASGFGDRRLPRRQPRPGPGEPGARSIARAGISAPSPFRVPAGRPSSISTPSPTPQADTPDHPSIVNGSIAAALCRSVRRRPVHHPHPRQRTVHQPPRWPCTSPSTPEPSPAARSICTGSKAPS